jgi:hypothetical protein
MTASSRNPLPHRHGKGRSQRIHDVLPRGREEKKVIGFAMCILHEGTWSTAPICYLEDLFVDAAERGAGAGKGSLML